MGSEGVKMEGAYMIVNQAEGVWVARLLVEGVGSGENHSGRRQQVAGVAVTELEGGVGFERGEGYSGGRVS